MRKIKEIFYQIYLNLCLLKYLLRNMIASVALIPTRKYIREEIAYHEENLTEAQKKEIEERDNQIEKAMVLVKKGEMNIEELRKMIKDKTLYFSNVSNMNVYEKLFKTLQNKNLLTEADVREFNEPNNSVKEIREKIEHLDSIIKRQYHKSIFTSVRSLNIKNLKEVI
jgi:hypothetical protein